MKRLYDILLAPLVFIAGLIAAMIVAALDGCGGAGRVAPVGTPASLVASDEASFAAALVRAAKTPGMTIRLAADITETADVMYLRGKGTTLDLAGHTFTYSNHFTGLNHGGCGLYVMPELGEAEPYNKAAVNVIFCNGPGATQAIETALGGNAPAGTFVEPCPIQYPGTLRDTYTRMRRILTPAQNITVKNGTFRCGDAQAFAVLGIAWAKGVTVQGVTFDYSGGADANAGTGAQESEDVTFTGCDLGGRHAAFGGGCWNVSVTGCHNGNVTFEEACVGVTVKGCNLTDLRSNDAACRDFTVTGNTFTNPDVNFGCIALAEIGGTNVFSGNTLQGCGLMWVGTVGKGGTLAVKGNTGRAFAQYGTGTVIQSGNSWQGAH